MSDRFDIRVQNMSCENCATRAQAALAAVPGLTGVTVSFPSQSAKFSADSAKSLKAAFAALQAVGYPGALKDDVDAAHRRAREDAEPTLRRTVLFATLLALPVIILGLGSWISPALSASIEASIGSETSWQLQSVLTAVLMLGPGFRIYRRGLSALVRGQPGKDSIVALITGVAYAASVLVLTAPELVSQPLRQVYFDVVCVIILLALLRSWRAARAKSRQLNA